MVNACSHALTPESISLGAQTIGTILDPVSVQRMKCELDVPALQYRYHCYNRDNNM